MSQPLSYGIGDDRLYRRYYRHSNNLSLSALVIYGTSGILIALVLAAIYAYALVHVPSVYLRLAGAVVFALALSIFVAAFVQEAKIRSRPLFFGSVIAFTLLSYAFHWIVWVYVFLSYHRSGVHFLPILLNPVRVIQIIVLTYRFGAWSFHGNMLAGPALGIAWLAEAAIIIGVPIAAARRLKLPNPFCDNCNIKCPDGPRLRKLENTDLNMLRQRMEAGDWAYLDQLQTPSEHAAAYISLIHHACPRCGKLNTLTANLILSTINSHGRRVVIVRPVVDKLMVTREDIEAIRRYLPVEPIIEEPHDENVEPAES